MEIGQSSRILISLLLLIGGLAVSTALVPVQDISVDSGTDTPLDINVDNSLDGGLDNSVISGSDYPVDDPTASRPGGSVTGYPPPFQFINNVCIDTPLNCNNAVKYRTITGVCNNLQVPRWGAMATAFRRIISPLSVSPLPAVLPWSCEPLNLQAERPNPRLVSSTIHQSLSDVSTEITHMVMQFGQYLDHDITLTPQDAAPNCCLPTTTNPSCIPIPIPANDSFYSQFGVTCLDLKRSTAFCPLNVTTREQMNLLTAFVDASNIYGSDETLAAQLRDGPMMKTTIMVINGIAKEFLPQIGGVFRTGDVRALENPGLTSLHTLWVREHNRIAKELAPKFSDPETLFQETRRILIAEYQNIVFDEYLPVLIGYKVMGSRNMRLPLDPYASTNYDPNTNPSILNEFSTAAYRFGHSLIQGLISLYFPKTGGFKSNFALSENFNSPVKYLENNGSGMEELIYGMTKQAAQKFDRYLTDQVTNHLFPSPGAAFGSDLASRNIRRGRDHDLPGYCTYCSLFLTNCNCRCWNDPQRPPFFTKYQWGLLRTLYAHPRDIDLFTGGLMEQTRPMSEGVGITGFVFNNILAEQFRRLMQGDRFFFTHIQAGFSGPQRRMIRRRTLADVICDNTDVVQTQRNVFLVEDSITNPKRLCSLRNRLDLSLF